MQETVHYCWESLEEGEEETKEEVDFWTNILTAVLSLLAGDDFLLLLYQRLCSFTPQ
jgi:hypothetical protein